MKRIVSVALAGFLLLGSGNASALVLGRISVDSAPGEPLRARIALFSLPGGGTEGVTARLGSEEQFARAGLDRPAHLESLRFTVDPGAGASGRIGITGSEPVAAPFHFLVEVTGPRQRALREYTILPASVAQGVAVPATGGSTYGPVSETDTLWSIATRHRPAGISVQRMMLALLAANPQGFGIDNINTLRAGALLGIPERDRIGPDARQSAIEEVRRQNAAWEVYRERVGQSFMMLPETIAGERGFPLPVDSGAGERVRAEGGIEAELRVVATGSGESPSGSGLEALRDERDLALEEADSKRREIGELKARLAEAERLISALRRLVELKDDTIAALKRQLATRPAASEAPGGPGAGDASIGLPAPPAAGDGLAGTPVTAPEAGDVAGSLRALGEAPGRAAAGERPGGRREGPFDVEPGMLETIEGRLGFSPVVGGVGLVGMILILGGLIALIRRGAPLAGEGEGRTASGSARDESAVEDLVAAGALPADQDAGAARSSGTTSRGTGVPGVDGGRDGIDIGFDLGLEEEDRKATEAHLRDPEIGAAGDGHERRAFGPEVAGDLDFDLAAPGERESGTVARDLASRLQELAVEAVPGERESGAVARERVDPPSLAAAWHGAGDASRERGASAAGADAGLPSAGGGGDEPEEERDAFEPDGGAPDENRHVSGVAGDAPDEARVDFGSAADTLDRMDEVQTKLDLAQAYLDIDDLESARGLVDEVLAEGNAEQRRIAGNLLSRIG